MSEENKKVPTIFNIKSSIEALKYVDQGAQALGRVLAVLASGADIEVINVASVPRITKEEGIIKWQVSGEEKITRDVVVNDYVVIALIDTKDVGGIFDEIRIKNYYGITYSYDTL